MYISELEIIIGLGSHLEFLNELKIIQNDDCHGNISAPSSGLIGSMVCEKKNKCEKHGMLQDTDGLKVIDMKLFL